MNFKQTLNNYQSYIIEKTLRDNCKNCRPVLINSIRKINNILKGFSSDSSTLDTLIRFYFTLGFESILHCLCLHIHLLLSFPEFHSFLLANILWSVCSCWCLLVFHYEISSIQFETWKTHAFPSGLAVSGSHCSAFSTSHLFLGHIAIIHRLDTKGVATAETLLGIIYLLSKLFLWSSITNNSRALPSDWKNCF